MSHLQVNPRLVVWPGDHLSWMILDAQGRPGPSFLLPQEAVAVLKAFLRPRRVEEVFSETTPEVEVALATCVEKELLGAADRCADLTPDADHANSWAGFLFRDHQYAKAQDDACGLIVRRHVLSGREILVLDGCANRRWIYAAHRWFFQLPYRRVDADTLETTFSRHWIATFAPAWDQVQVVPLFARLASLAIAVSDEHEAKIRRLDGYSATFGDLPLLHRDLEVGRGLTALFYGNAEWETDWGGETVFCDDSGEAMILVPPRPGRLVVFDGALLHRAGAPSRACHEARYALVFKFALPEFDRRFSSPATSSST